MHQFYKKELSRVKAWLLMSLLSIATIAACSNTAIEHHKMLTAKPTSTSCRIVHHTMGETCIPNNPKRIITIPFSILSDTLVLDFQPIASTSSFLSKEELTAKYLSTKTYLGNRTKGINYIGRTYTTPNIERMLLLKPDLILAWDRLSRIYPLLSKIAPTVMVPWQTPFHWENSFNFIAEALEKKKLHSELGTIIINELKN